MSAQITVEKREVEQSAVYLDGRGDVYCASCHHNSGSAYGPIERHDAGDVESGATCARCEEPVTASVEVVSGSFVVEYPPCKVF